MEEGVELKIISSDNSSIQKTKIIGQSKFYDDVTPSVGSPEKQDQMKPDDYGEEGIDYYNFHCECNF